MKLTLTQQVIMAEIKKSGSITARRVMEITGCVYRDSMDYVYQTLGRMVKAGLIKRTGPGVFGPKGGAYSQNGSGLAYIMEMRLPTVGGAAR
jgi:DNA-binding PadR family transcriptional regulator